jgi:hypothetical protein
VHWSVPPARPRRRRDPAALVACHAWRRANQSSGSPFSSARPRRRSAGRHTCARPLLRRAQARARRASLIGEQLGDATPPFYFVDFMAVEDLAATLGLDAAVSAIAERDDRTVEAVMDSWHQAIERIASDERCRFVDSLRPYVERIENELDGEDLVA